MPNLTNPHRIPCPWACGFHTEYWDVLGEHACGCPHREWENPQAEPLVTVEETLRAKKAVDRTMAEVLKLWDVGAFFMPLYTGRLEAWRCSNCGGLTHLRAGVLPGSLTCNAMGCSGKIRRVPELDYEVDDVRSFDAAAEAIIDQRWKAIAGNLRRILSK